MGRDIHELAELELLFDRIAVWILAAGGVLLISASARRRVAAINTGTTTRLIMAGDRSKRVPVTESWDEYDDLAVNINEMIAQIELLLERSPDATDAVRNRLETLAH